MYGLSIGEVHETATVLLSFGVSVTVYIPDDAKDSMSFFAEKKHRLKASQLGLRSSSKVTSTIDLLGSRGVVAMNKLQRS